LRPAFRSRVLLNQSFDGDRYTPNSAGAFGIEMVALADVNLDI